ncbi:MAG: D-alanine--D-alanine ligase [Kiritimatiellae bacterium]|nr:D-alanine--D-alanine ligase [Kiritimatiellia bacterium]MDD5522643.1 D-alanine--D-alanine ligase [Kiritimatiellia bacterium]
MNKQFKKVAVLMGGPSSEREVSLRSGAAVAKGLRESGYEVVEVDVKGPDFSIPAGIEAVFIALHGEFGEDGQIQELLERKKLPYTGSGPEASRRSFNKILSKKVFVKNGIPTPEYEVLEKGQKRSLKLPVVIKPACQGSSIGIHRVLVESEWDKAQADAFLYGSEMVVEAYIKGRELTVGVVNNEALPIIEIVAPDDWYDYKAKYIKGTSRYLVPAPVDDNTSKLCWQIALKTFEKLGCRSLGRVDFRLSEEGRLYVLELNNIPGFTETSLLPKAAAQAGVNFASLCDRIMKTACTDDK